MFFSFFIWIIWNTADELTLFTVTTEADLGKDRPGHLGTSHQKLFVNFNAKPPLGVFVSVILSENIPKGSFCCFFTVKHDKIFLIKISEITRNVLNYIVFIISYSFKEIISQYMMHNRFKSPFP
jgi:hypothetical protein